MLPLLLSLLGAPADAAPVPGTATFVIADQWDLTDLRQATVTNAGCPKGSVSLRSGAHHSAGSATVEAALSPGATVTGVAFAYKYTTGYSGPIGSNFSLVVAGKSVFASQPLTLFPYSKTGDFSPTTPVAAKGLAIKVAPGTDRLVFNFQNNDRNMQLLLPMTITVTCDRDPCKAPPPPKLNMTTWHVVWTGGQSNSVGTNSQKSGYPTWPTTSRIQMFCTENPIFPSHRCRPGSFAPAQVPLYGESNVGFSQTFANLLLATLPADHGVVTLNTGVGGTGFSDGRWVVPNGPLTTNSISAVGKLQAALPAALGGTYHFSTMLWHQGEEDAGDNHQHYHASYCHYLQDDMGALIDHLRANFPGATAGTPFLDGGMLPYWVDAVNGTEGVMGAIYGLNTSRPCTGTADSRIFPDFFPGTKTPAGEPGHRSGYSGDVIHFNATMATIMGHQYWAAYQRALQVQTPVASAKTAACKKEAGVVAPMVTCTK